MPDTWWWILQLSAAFLYFIIQNGVGPMNSSARTDCGDGITDDRRFKNLLKLIVDRHLCLESRMYHVLKCFNCVNTFVKVVNQPRMVLIKVDRKMFRDQ